MLKATQLTFTKDLLVYYNYSICAVIDRESAVVSLVYEVIGEIG